MKLKIKTRSFYSYFTIKYIYPTITPSLSLYITLSLSLSHFLSLIGLGCQFFCYFLGNQTEFNCSLYLALYLALALTLSLSLSHRSLQLIFLLFSRRPNKFSTQFFYYSNKLMQLANGKFSGFMLVQLVKFLFIE